MPLSSRSLFALALVPLLAACASGSAVKPPAAKPAPTRTAVRVPSKRPPPPPRVQVLPGLEGVVGATADDLVRQFGPARLDTSEGDARKLQFSGTACVLDVYLYPGAAGREPQASYVDARRASDGNDVDRAACIAALRKR